MGLMPPNEVKLVDGAGHRVGPSCLDQWDRHLRDLYVDGEIDLDDYLARMDRLYAGKYPGLDPEVTGLTGMQFPPGPSGAVGWQGPAGSTIAWSPQLGVMVTVGPAPVGPAPAQHEATPIKPPGGTA